jgi:hypothetical protein
VVHLAKGTSDSLAGNGLRELPRDGETVHDKPLLVIGPGGEEVMQGPYGVDAEAILYVEVET